MSNNYFGLDSEQKREIINYYLTADRSSGRATVVKWSNLTGQLKRFEVLSQIGNLAGKTILDVGCGLGDLFGYLQQQVGKINYTGIDIVPKFIDLAKQSYPQGKFFNKELAEVSGKFDYVVCSGALNKKFPNYLPVYESMIKHMYSLSSQATGFNMLNVAFHPDDETYCAYNPETVLEFCKSFAAKAEVVTGYLKQDFTIFLYH